MFHKLYLLQLLMLQILEQLLLKKPLKELLLFLKYLTEQKQVLLLLVKRLVFLLASV